MDASQPNPNLQPNYLFTIVGSALVLVTAYWFVLQWTWNWSLSVISLTSFGSLNKHLPALKDGVYAWLQWPDSGRLWFEYWQQVESRDVVGSFYFHTLFPLFVSLALSVYAGYMILKKTTPRDIHLRGMQYLKDYRTSLAAARRSTFREMKQEDKEGVCIHPKIPLSYGRESKGMLMVGPSGSGKSQVMFYLLDQLVQSGQRILIHDHKGEFTKSLDLKSDQYVIVAPWDRRSVEWHISGDLRTKADARMFANFVIQESRDPMWANAARQVLTGLLTHLIRTKPGHWGFGDLREVLSASRGALYHIIKECNPEALEVVENLHSQEGRTGEGVIINLKAYLSAFYDVADAWRKDVGDFSIRRWLDDDYDGPRIVIMQGSKQFEEISRGVNRSLLNFAISKMADTAFPEVRKRQQDYRVYFVLDELTKLGRVEAMEDLISVGRSKGAVPIIGIQDFGQVAETYGAEKPNIWFSQLATKFIGGMSPGKTANWVTNEMIGEREVSRPAQTNNVDDNGRQTVSVSYDKRIEKILLPSQLSSELYANEKHIVGLLLCSGWNHIHRIKWDTQDLPEFREQVELDDWAIAPTQPVAGAFDVAEYERRQEVINKAQNAQQKKQQSTGSNSKKTETNSRPIKKKTKKHLVLVEVADSDDKSTKKRRKTKTVCDPENVRQEKANTKAQSLKLEGVLFNKILKDAEKQYLAGEITESEYDGIIDSERYKSFELELD